MKINLIERIDIHYSTPSALDRIKVENKQIPILIFEEAKGRGWGRMLIIERDRASNYSKIYESIFSSALMTFEKMFDLYERKQNIMKMTIYQGALLSLQHMEGDNKDDPMQSLYTTRVRQLKKK